MANSGAILDKIRRNLEFQGITVTADGVSATTSRRYLQAGNVTIHYQDADLASPMGGVPDTSSPYLGIGIANPGSLVLAGLVDADTTVADIFVSENDYRILRVCTGFANDIAVKAGRTDLSILDDDLMTLPGDPDRIGMGE